MSDLNSLVAAEEEVIIDLAALDAGTLLILSKNFSLSELFFTKKKLELKKIPISGKSINMQQTTCDRTTCLELQ